MIFTHPLRPCRVGRNFPCGFTDLNKPKLASWPAFQRRLPVHEQTPVRGQARRRRKGKGSRLQRQAHPLAPAPEPWNDLRELGPLCRVLVPALRQQLCVGGILLWRRRGAALQPGNHARWRHLWPSAVHHPLCNLHISGQREGVQREPGCSVGALLTPAGCRQ